MAAQNSNSADEKSLRIEIRDARLRGGRLNISAHTTKEKVRQGREATVRALLDNGDHETLDLLRSRRLHITDVQAALRRGTLADLQPELHSRGVTLEDALSKVLKTVEATSEPGTHAQFTVYANALRVHFGPNALLSSVTHDAAEAFLHGARPKTSKPYAPTTQKHVRTFARHVWREAGMRKDPWVDVQLPKARATRHAFLQPAQWQTLYDCVQGTPVAAGLAIGTLAGLRIGEICQLRPGIDVDFERRRIRIQPRDGENKWRPKTDNSIRDVPMEPKLTEILRAHIDAGFAGERYLIIAAKRDRPLPTDTLRGWMEEAMRRAGLNYGMAGDGLTPHSLRHTFASWLAQRDVQLVKIARLLGDTVETVAKYYSHLLPTDLEKTVEVIGQVAWQE